MLLPQTTEHSKKSKKKSKVHKWEDSLLQRGIKSVEWIKKQCEEDRDSIVQVKISSKSKHVVHFNVKAGDIVMWQFATKKRDIAFGVLFESTQVAEEETPVQNEATATDKMLSILPLLRVPSNSFVIEGSHTAPSDGLYVIGWDNAFSRFFAKELFYKITTKMSEASSRPEVSSEHSISNVPSGTDADLKKKSSVDGGRVCMDRTASPDVSAQLDANQRLQPSANVSEQRSMDQQQQQYLQQHESLIGNHPIIDL
jgi:hypothetical protein